MNKGIEIIYDGECPFCNDFIIVSNIKKTFGNIKMTNARNSNEQSVIMVKRQGINLDDGMVVIKEDGSLLYGDKAARFITIYGKGDGIRAFVYRLVLRNEKFAAFSYPALVLLRKLYFKIVGKRWINEE
ncbi:DUF393 domain-containing protein [Gammaproteobacteria bacterium]|nr:DUF393 domain-containing protein [Gammaproteobacteria bacterium]MDC3312936.1 DUF393 domain-containing protein [Gammaproteobacteria bacterium]